MLLKSLAHKVIMAATGSVIAIGASGQVSTQVQTTAHPTVRITGKIDNSVTMSLAGTHPAVVDHAVIGARLSPSKPLSHMKLVLAPTDDQVYALRTLMDQQQDKTSPNFHKWLTPDSYGQTFGVASADVAKITAWLQDQGFAVNSIARSNRLITFSGTVGQVETAFHTQMNNITVAGEAHISNTTDIVVPQAFAGIVRGVASLNDFLPKSNIVNPRKVQVATGIPANNYITPDTNPLFSSVSSGAHYVTPGDAATIFNSTPLLSSGIDGTGQTIAVIGQTDISLADVQQFRSMFGLKKNDPTFTIVGEDPGVTADDVEAYLDVEWAGGMAPGANVNFIVAGSDFETDSGIDESALYAVDNNIGDIITLSYGGCESSNGASGTAFYNTLWEQAAAQGQSVFVSSGDAGATGCYQNQTYGTAYGVNALGSSDYNVAVGGSMFVDFGPSQYWTTGSQAPAPAGYNFATATSYVPEAAWNEGFLTTTDLNTASTGTVTGNSVAGGGGGISIFTARPTWQTGSNIPAADPTNCSQHNAAGTCAASGVMGQTSGVHRLVPDIAMIAAGGHDATGFCYEGACFNNTAGYSFGLVGGTSVAAPVSASIQALINQKNGGRQGNPNFHYYPLANVDYVSGACKSMNGTLSSPTVVLPGANCNFHDIVTGSNVEKQSFGDTTGLGFFAATGYDEASGLGSVNIFRIATNWSTVSLTSTTTTFTLTPTNTTHGSSQTLAVTVAASAGTPTGDISLIAVGTTLGTPQQYTLTSGAYSGTITGLPGGTYSVHVHYAGDGTYAPSDSAPQTITITPETSTVSPALYDFSPGFVTNQGQNGGTVPYGYIDDLIATVAGTSSNGTPTGTMTFAVTNTTSGTTLPSLTEKLDGSGVAALIAGGTYTSLLVAANYPALSPGAYSVTASYSGDNSFKASSGASTFTISQQTPTATLKLSSAYIPSGASETLTYTVARLGGSTIASTAAYPTGTVTFARFDSTSGSTLGTATLNSVGVATITSTGITTTGANTITATYTGDSNYALVSTTGTVTVGAYTATTTTVAAPPGVYYVGSSSAFTATVSPAASATVLFYDGTNYLGSATSNATTGVATYNTPALTAGTHTINASFAGTSTYAASSGSASLTVLKNITSIAVETNTVATVGQVVAINGRILRSPSSTSAPAVPLTGTVTFYDGTTSIGTATPVFQPGGSAYYVATLSISTLGRGTHTLTATYANDPNYAASTSGVITLTVLPDDVWVANSGGTVSAVTASGTAMANTAGGGTGIAIDNAGDIWSLNKSASSVAEFSNTGTVTSSGYTGAGISAPTALAIDGSGMVWITNSNSTVSELSNAGAAVSGSGGYPTTTSTPSSLSIDASGNLWITNAGDNSLTEVIGAAAPVTTPTTMAVKNNNLAAKP